VLVNVTDFELLAPTVMFPKATDDGFEVSCAVPALTAVADSGTERFFPCVSVVTFKDPVTAPVVLGANLTVAVTDCDGANVTGVATPDTLNPVPVVENAVTLIDAVPAFVTETGTVLELPTVTFPTATDDGFALSCAVPVVTAVADKGMDRFCPCVSVVKLREPLIEPAAVGANFTVAVTVCEALSETGVTTPETLNPVPAIEIEVMLIAEVPVFVIETVCVTDVPVVTEPKLREAELGLKIPVPPLVEGEFVGPAPMPQPEVTRKRIPMNAIATALTGAFEGRLEVCLRLTFFSCTCRDSAYALPKQFRRQNDSERLFS
jgi:hypothetical protein